MFVNNLRNSGLKFPLFKKKAKSRGMANIRALLVTVIAATFLHVQDAHAFTWFEWPDQFEPCFMPTKCQKGHNQVAEQDNGYHDMLQGRRGPMAPTVNVYESVAEDYAAGTPAEYLTTDPEFMPYTGVTGPYRYGIAGTTSYAPGTAAVSPNPPTYPVNPQLDYGVQGAMTRFKPDVTGGKHIFMPPKNTPAESLVDMFPWLYMDVHPYAQNLLYRGTGNNTGADVNNPMNLNIEGSSYNLSPSNAEEYGSLDNPAKVEEQELNRHKCLKLRFRENKCRFLGMNMDLLSDTIGDWLDEDGYISRSPALFARLNMDSCTNQVIIPMGLNPNYVFNDELRRRDSAYNENWCQPFRTKPIDCYRNRLSSSGDCLTDKGSRDGRLYDYRAWGYLRFAWKSVLRSPYTPSGGGGLYYGGQMGIGMPPYLTQTTFNQAAGIPALTLQFPGTLELVKDVPNSYPAAVTGASIPGEEAYGDPFMPLFPGGSVGPIGAMVSYIGTYGGALTLVNDLARQPYERIWDPTHPYSPRWDFRGTDRLFSALARLSEPPVTGMGYTSSTSTCIVRCAAVPVDILSFRLLAFSACIGCRINQNAAAFWVQTIYMMSDVEVSLYGVSVTCVGVQQDRAVENSLKNRVLGPLTGWIGQIAIPGVTHGRLDDNAGETIRLNLWGIRITIPTQIAGGCHYYIAPPMFQKSNNHNTAVRMMIDNHDGPQRNNYDSLWPICSTMYDFKDSLLNVASCAMCTIISGDSDVFNGIRNCCDDVAHAVAPINTLKIRNTRFNPGLVPTPEGYSFKEYWSFRDDTRVSPYSPASDESVLQTTDDDGNTGDYISSHMPYMRWWDTGTAAGGGTNWNGINDYNPDLDCGRYDTIVGVGTEDWEGDETKTDPPAPSYNATPDDPRYVYDMVKNNAAKYCRYGGNGFAIDADTGVPLSGEAITNILVAFGTTATGIQYIEDFLGVSLSEIGLPPYYRCIRLRTFDIAHRKLGGDAMTSWLELKLYQMRAIQRGLNCLPQYEKFHKPYGSEEFTLNALGASYNAPILLNRSAVNNADAMDPAKGPEQGYYKLPYAGAPTSNPPRLPSTGSGPDITPQSNYMTGSGGDAFEMQNIAWPLAWRGYISETDCKLAFPNFAGDGMAFGSATGYLSFFSPGFTLTAPCGTTLTGWAVSGWTIPGIASPLGNVPGPPFPNPSSKPIPAPAGYGFPRLWPFMPGGLDRAEIGDIVYLTHEDMNYALAVTYINQIMGWGNTSYYTGGMPYAAVVVGTHTTWEAKDGSTRAPVDTPSDCPPNEMNCFTRCEASVTLAEVNNGKFPDVCGNTDMYGYGQNRIIYKEWLPQQVMDYVFPDGIVVTDTCGHSYTTQRPSFQTLLVEDHDGNTHINWGRFNSNYGSCSDPRMGQCTYADIGLGAVNGDSVNLWDHFRIYRPLWDIRE